MMALAGLDITGAVRELFESAVMLGCEALQALGLSEANIETIEAEYRRRDGSRLEAQISSGDITVRRDMLFNHERSLDLQPDGDPPDDTDEKCG